MNLSKLSSIKKLCKECGIRPNKKFGQNFLVPSAWENILNKIIVQAELKKSDLVLEIGPGFGALTFELVKHAGQVVAVEKDKRLAEFLINSKKQLINNKKNLEILQGDVLKIKNFDLFKNYKIKNYKIISNLPYQITSPVLWRFLHKEKHKPELMVLMVQKEVAERIIARPGKMNILSVMCQFYSQPKIIAFVKKENFWPMPEVDSAIIKLKINRRSKALPCSEKDFFRLVKIRFSAKRKMLKNNLSAGLKIPAGKIEDALNKIGLNKKVRAQDLGIDDWVKLSKAIF